MRDPELEVAALLQGIAPRPEPPADVRARVFEAVEREWRQHKRRRWRLPAALAATMVLAVAAAFLATRPNVPVMAQLADTGGFWVDGALYRQGGTDLTLSPGTVLEADADTRLVTGTAEVRLRSGTRMIWRSTEAVSLERGSVYVRTGGGGRLRVHTPLGVISDIGTTFMVTLRDGALEVALREGAASIDTVQGTYVARAEGLRGDVVSVEGRHISRRSDPASAGRWQWIHAVHPGYAERDLVPLLEAVAADLGLRLGFASSEAGSAARASRLEGDLSGLGPEQALEVALASTGFISSREPDGRLVVEFPSEHD